MRSKLLFLSIVLITLFTSCSVKQFVKGEFYLSNERYKEGIRSFEEELRNNPNDHKVNYYLGRLYLGNNQHKEGLAYIKKATELDPVNANYQFWLGIAYSESKLPNMEWRSYEKALTLDPNHLNSRIYLAHTQMERKQYKEALRNYSLILKKWPDEPATLYNYALALNKLQRTEEEKAAWKEYLDFYPSGPMARNAVDHLNRLGDFSYRNHLIGLRTITLRKVQFKPSTKTLTTDSEESLKFLGEVLKNSDNISIHIVTYQKNNKELAKQKSKCIKEYLLEHFPEFKSSRLKVSWFDVSERINAGKKKFIVDESVNFITSS